MGTSTSNPGPSDRQPLLPSWAFPSDTNNGREPNGTDDQSTNNGEQAGSNLPLKPSTNWQAAKTSMSRFASTGDRSSLTNAGRAYVGAKGGRKAAAQAARAGKAAAIKVGGFLSTVTRTGIRSALNEIGLGHMIGRSAPEVLAALLDLLAPTGATLQEAAARKAVDDVLEKLYEEHIAKTDDLYALDGLDSKSVAEAIEASVAGYIYNLWLNELGLRIETYAISPLKAANLERDVKEYVKERVRLELKDNDPVSIDWNGSVGRNIIDTVFEEAYGFLEVGQ